MRSVYCCHHLKQIKHNVLLSFRMTDLKSYVCWVSVPYAGLGKEGHGGRSVGIFCNIEIDYDLCLLEHKAH